MSSSFAARAGSIRQRSRKACNPCRRRKRKCNGQKPCDSCIEFEYDCEYDDEPRQDRPPQDTQPVTIASAGQDIQRVSPESQTKDQNFFEPDKRRYYDAGSAISFPRAIALSLRAGYSPRLHSFAYNVGPVAERFIARPTAHLSTLVEREGAVVYARQYFKDVNRTFYLIDEDEFVPEFLRLWDDPAHGTLQFETLACFVILLGSLFSWPQHFDEQQDLADHAQALLDKSSFHHAPSQIHIEHAQAWVLRTIYLRCITRPNITWISSCIMMHILETLGMHREYNTLGTAGLNLPALSPAHLERRRRIFWSAWTLNRMISFELGRSPTLVSHTNSLLPDPTRATPAPDIINAYRLIYPDGGHSLAADCSAALLTISDYAETRGPKEPVVALTCADIACGLYRQIHKETPHVREALGQQLVKTVRRGLTAARHLLQASQPWWLLISTPFQFICVAVAVGKSYILDALPEAMTLLQEVSAKFGSHIAQEACETAQKLLQVAISVRDEETTSIRQAQNLDVPPRGSDPSEPIGLSFDEFLDANFPYGSWDPSQTIT